MTRRSPTAKTDLPPGKFAIGCCDPGAAFEDSLLFLGSGEPESEEPAIFDTEQEARSRARYESARLQREATALGLNLPDDVFDGVCILHRTANGQLVRIPVG
jgi:hypothetical protein